MVLITAAEAAEILGVTPRTVHDYASRSRLPRHALSHVRKAYDRDEVEALSLSRMRRIHEPHPYWATAERPPRCSASHTPTCR